MTSPAAREASERGAAARRGRRLRSCLGCAGARGGLGSRAGAGGECRRAATFITCIPRQMPRKGRSRSIARRANASSKSSRSIDHAGVRRGSLAVGGRVHVGAAGEDQTVEQVEDRVGIREKRSGPPPSARAISGRLSCSRPARARPAGAASSPRRRGARSPSGRPSDEAPAQAPVARRLSTSACAAGLRGGVASRKTCHTVGMRSRNSRSISLEARSISSALRPSARSTRAATSSRSGDERHGQQLEHAVDARMGLDDLGDRLALLGRRRLADEQVLGVATEGHRDHRQQHADRQPRPGRRRPGCRWPGTSRRRRRPGRRR